MLNIYVGTYHNYNCGSIRGKWLNLPLTDDELKSDLDWIAQGEHDPEYMIQDYETDFNIKVDESQDINELNELAQKTDNWSETQKEVFGYFIEDCGLDIDEAFEKVDNWDFYFVEADNETELAQNYIDELGGFACLSRETLERYFDFESFGRDMAFDFTKLDSGYISDN